jgi:hypothetical protein
VATRITNTVSRRAAVVFAFCAAAACNRRKRSLAAYTDEEVSLLASALLVSDPRVAQQLISGWYPVEQNSWRWTAKRFAAVLGLPPGAVQKGAVLKLHFAIPDAVIAQLKQLTVTASVQGALLPPETYSKPGDAIYTRDLPASLLSGSSMRVDFILDKALPPSPSDRRELGVVVSRLTLEPK